MSKFVHLHVHSEFSLLDGLSKIPKLVAQSKNSGMKHLALTDHGSLYGAIKFYKECRQENVNPIIGCEMYIAKRGLSQKEAGKDNENFHLTVLASNDQGYRNLLKLVSIAYLEGFYYRPRVDKETLQKHSGGLIALSGCNSSEIAKALIGGNFEGAKKLSMIYSQIFGKNNFYFEIQRHEYEKFKTAHSAGSEIFSDLERMEREEKSIIEGTKKLASLTGLKVVATNDVHYVLSSDAQAQDAIVCIQTGKTIADTKRLRMIDSPTYYLKSEAEMKALFEDFPEALQETLEIAKRVNIDISLGKVAFPNYTVTGKLQPGEYLRKLCYERIDKRLKLTSDVKERLEYELSVIAKKGYSTYFLVVADFVNWSRERGIISTTRGSASGSLVSYALGITTVNPLYFKLPFERFLNLWRPTLPDIDVDFEDDRRDEVISYVREKYGVDKVAQISTFGTMMARAAVRDVARVLSWPYTKADRIAKMIPIGAQGFHMTLADAKKQNKELGQLFRDDGEVQELLDLAEKVEGNARHVSVHAAGVVISPEDLTNYTPLQKETSGEKVITQYDMYDIEEVGLVKMDFLGIRNLSILGQSVKIVREFRNKEVDLGKIPVDDKKAFELMARGETMGLFQLSGSGMTRYLKDLKPTNIFDIMAMISLFRPGPMNSIPEFIERKHNPKKIKYFDSRMHEYLDQSYGVIVYQDDVLLTAIEIAGYSWEEADKFRKAIGKKIPAEMAKQKQKFIEGCVKNGMSGDKAKDLFSLIEPFAAYGFNKAHAASYAVIAYQTAYMKANFPVEFMAAVMSAEADDPDKIAAAVDECARMEIIVLPPDVNYSATGFAIEKIDSKQSASASTLGKREGIRFGLSAIKNVGRAAIEAILVERDENGRFGSIDDFVKRVNLRVVNRKTLESLIKAGAMDRFGNRNAMLKVIDEIKASGVSLSKSIAQGQGSLFGEGDISESTSLNSAIETILGSTEEAPKEEILSWERELLGLYLTEHPLSKVSERLNSLVDTKISDIDLTSLSGQAIKIGGIIVSSRKTITKVRREEMCFLKLQDLSGSVEVIVFPKLYESVKNFLVLDQIVIVDGRLDDSEESRIMIADKISPFDTEFDFSKDTKLYLEVAIPQNTDRVLLAKIYQILKNNQGDTPTYLVLNSDGSGDRKIPVPFGVDKTYDLETELSVLGCRIVN